MSTFDMSNTIDVALKMDVYAIYLCKSRADLEAEKLGDGETVSLPEDNNIYRTNRCAKNAIDETLCYEGRKHNKLPKRLEYGYDIIGKKNKIG